MNRELRKLIQQSEDMLEWAKAHGYAPGVLHIDEKKWHTVEVSSMGLGEPIVHIDGVRVSPDSHFDEMKIVSKSDTEHRTETEAEDG